LVTLAYDKQGALPLKLYLIRQGLFVLNKYRHSAGAGFNLTYVVANFVKRIAII